MTIDAVLLIMMGVMFAAAIYLLMDRTLATNHISGLMMFTNAANLLIIIMAGPPGFRRSFVTTSPPMST